jgi:hypothetical protein
LGGDSDADGASVISIFRTAAESQTGCSNNQPMEEDFDSDGIVADPGCMDSTDIRTSMFYFRVQGPIQIQTQDLFIQFHNQHSLNFLKEQ